MFIVHGKKLKIPKLIPYFLLGMKLIFALISTIETAKAKLKDFFLCLESRLFKKEKEEEKSQKFPDKLKVAQLSEW